MDFDTLTHLFNRFARGADNLYVVAAELLLIGVLVNWCAGVLHGTRGTRLLRGLLVVLVAATLIVSLLADQLGLARLELLYHYFIIGMAFIALVAFQPELRRALIRAGEMRFIRRVLPHGKLISELVEAAGYLSRNRYGALIAIQRDVGLANWAENGTPLNAEVSANLLKTIFFPNSALHDLGVIIRGNRVLAAGCQFPVAESGEVDASLGSRHRAAVGLSSESDALVLIVSEETGTISLADHGKLTRFLALDDLEEELESRLAGHPASPHHRRTARTLSDTWRFLRRLLVVAPLTVVIWFLADQASRFDAEINLQLNIRHDSSLQVDVHWPDSPPVFQVTLRGPRRHIEAMTQAADDSPLQFDWVLPAAYARSGHPHLRADELRAVIENLPALREAGVFVVSTDPDNLDFTVDEVVTIPVPVRVDAGALRVDVLRVEPERAQVALRSADRDRLNPEQLVIEAKLDEKRLIGEPRNQLVNLTGVALERRVGDAEALRVDPAEVDIRLRIEAVQGQRRLEGILVHLAVSPQVWRGYEIEIADANEWLIELEVEGDRTVLESLRPQDVYALVPITSDHATPTTEFRSIEVVVELPAGVTLVGPPRQVQFRLVPKEGAAP